MSAFDLWVKDRDRRHAYSECLRLTQKVPLMTVGSAFLLVVGQSNWNKSGKYKVVKYVAEGRAHLFLIFLVFPCDTYSC